MFENNNFTKISSDTIDLGAAFEFGAPLAVEDEDSIIYPVAALVGSSDFNAKHFLELDKDGVFDYVIAVDGGLKSLEAIGRAADAAIGDFDSLGYIPEESAFTLGVHSFSTQKDCSDMELAFHFAAEKLGVGQFFVYGALGGRLDHTMASFQLFKKFSAHGYIVTAITIENEVEILTGPAAYEFDENINGTISVFALSDCCTLVSEEGLAYPLDNVDLTNEMTLGLSNEFTGQPSCVSVGSGTIAIFSPADHF